MIHTVGPVWRGGKRGEPELLASAYRESLRLAAGRKLASIAFPAISTGVYGYPRDAAARIAYGTITEFLAANEHPGIVALVFFGREDADAFVSAVG